MTFELPESNRPVVGAVDVGSNSIKLTVATLDASGNLEELASALETVRLGAGLGETGRLAEDRIEAALSALTAFAHIARGHGAIELVGVATEATRRAANGETFLRRVLDETGWSVALIDGEREAELTFRGVAAQGDVGGPVVIADIGGGSTELIVASGGEVVQAQSVAIGSGSLTERFLHSDPPTGDEIAAVAGWVSAQLGDLALRHDSPTRLIVVGGTAEYLARMVDRSQHVNVGEIGQALAMCQSTPSMELANRLAIQEARARVLPAGIVVIRELTSLLNVPEITVAASGIRVGLLLETFARLARVSTLERNELHD